MPINVHTVFPTVQEGLTALPDRSLIDSRLLRLSKAVKAPVSHAEVFRVRSGGNRSNGCPGASNLRGPLEVTAAGPGKGQLAIVHDALQKFRRQFG